MTVVDSRLDWIGAVPEVHQRLGRLAYVALS